MKLILDATAGGRQMWFVKNHPSVVYMDKRQVEPGQFAEYGNPGFGVEPDIIADFTDIPFPDESFYLVVFDPPHASISDESIMGIKYGTLGENWKQELVEGFKECWRVLLPYGTLIFKWNERQHKVREVLDMLPDYMEPLFGHPTGKSGSTKWIAFMKDAPLSVEYDY
jgi:SAM-dependent methyltransferase